MSPSSAPRLQAVLFDMSKTLWRPLPQTRTARTRQAAAALYTALQRYYPTLALPTLATFEQVLHAAQRQYGPTVHSNEELLDYVGAVFGWDLDPADPLVLEAWHAPKLEQAQSAPDLPQTLAALQALGLRLGVISNTKWHGPLHDRELAHHGLLAYFPVRIYSADLGIRKPDPRIFTAARTALGAVPAGEVLYIGDKLDTDVAGAQRAGLRTAWLVPPGERAAPAGEEVQPDLVLTALRDLPAQLRGHFQLPATRPEMGSFLVRGYL